jgi:tetratricopeptide (TPR) repeat protein
LRKIGQIDKSIEDLEKAVKLDEKNPSGHNNLGLSFFESGRYDDAITHYTKAINIEAAKDPRIQDKSRLSVLYNNRGLAFYHSRKNNESKKDFHNQFEFKKPLL